MYRYELHMHTREGSLCGRSSGAEMAEHYMSLGYTGAVVTDHFFRGNTKPNRSLPWHEFIDQYVSGYENMKKAAEGKDFDVFFGIEEKMKGYDEYIVLGITPQWLKEHPELPTLYGKDLLKLYHRAGAFIIHAHPYRERDYMVDRTIRLYPNDVDAVEVRNVGNTAECDRRAYEYAKKIGLPMTGGSDCHLANDEKAPSGIELPFRPGSVMELANAIRDGKATVIDLETAQNAPLSPPNYRVETFN